jgi:hypothetical protein
LLDGIAQAPRARSYGEEARATMEFAAGCAAARQDDLLVLFFTRIASKV